MTDAIVGETYDVVIAMGERGVSACEGTVTRRSDGMRGGWVMLHTVPEHVLGEVAYQLERAILRLPPKINA